MRLPALYSPRASSDSATTKPSTGIALPHFCAANGELHAPASPRRSRPEHPENSCKTSIDLTINRIRDVTAKIKASFARMDQTEAAFDHERHELDVWIERTHREQERLAQAYLTLFHASATHIQRAFRGFLARRAYREALALRAVLKIQRAFRAKQVRRTERRRQFRLLSKKIVRGMKGVRARQELTHNELLNRVSHNMMIERQWRMAMGVADTESDLLNALYRRKFMRQRLSILLLHVRTMSSVIRFWSRLVPQRPVEIQNNGDDDEQLPTEANGVTLEIEDNLMNDVDKDSSSPATAKPSLFSLTQQLSSPSKSSKSPPKTSRVTREDLRRKQKLYTQRVYEENLKKEAGRAAQIEKQREIARLAEEARKVHEDEQRRLRLEQAQALREDLERRGLLAIKELQFKKGEELRKEEEAHQRVVQAKERIAKEVLSDETQTLLSRRQRAQAQASVPKPKG